MPDALFRPPGPTFQGFKSHLSGTAPAGVEKDLPTTVQGLNRCKVREISGRSPSLPGRDRLLCGRKRFPEYYEPRPVGWKPDGKCDMSVLLLPGSRRPDLSTPGLQKFRSEERRVGKECVSTCSSRWSPY